MAETAIPSDTASLSCSNMLFDGDFIDLTSESEPQSQNNEDVVMVNETPRSQTETPKKSPDVNTCKKKLDPLTANTKEITMVVSSKNSQQIVFPVKLTTNLSGTHILVQQSVGREIGQLLAQGKGESNKARVTAAITGGQVSGLPAQKSPVQNSPKTPNKVSKSVGDMSSKCYQKFPFKTASVKKVGSKTNINPVAMQRYRPIKPAPSSNASRNIDVEDVILLPTSSETSRKEVEKNKHQDNIPVLTANQPNYDNVSLVPSQSESKSKTQVIRKPVSTVTPPSTPKRQGVVLSSLQDNYFQNLNLSTNNNDDDDVIFITDDPQKEETKKSKEMQPVLSLPVNVLKQGQLESVSNKISKLPQKTVFMQKKDSTDKGYIFLTPQQPPPISQTKRTTTPKSLVRVDKPSATPVKKPNLVVSQIEHPAKPLVKTLQHYQILQNFAVKDLKDTAATVQELETVENEVQSNCLKDLENVELPVPVEAVSGNIGGQQVYFLVYPSQEDDSAGKGIEDVDTESCTVIPDDEEIELGEPKIEPVFDEVIESDNDDLLQHFLEPTTSEPSYLFTPVDITEILNQGKTQRKTELKDRCDSVSLKNLNLYQRGFTKREMKRAHCIKFLQTFLKKEENKIKALKKSYFDKSNFVHCGKTFNNFLPETSQYDEGDPDDYIIEYNDIERRLTEEIYSTQTLPVITNVISKVNEEIIQMKTQQSKTKRREVEDLQTKLAKPEEALKLIKRGLELIQSWSKDTHSDKEKANKSLPVSTRRRPSIVVEPKRKRYSTPIEVVVEPPKKITRAKRNEVPPKKEEPKTRNPSSRRRTPTEKVTKGSLSEKVAKPSASENVAKVTSNITAVKEVRKRKTETRVEVKSPVKRGRKQKKNTDFDSVDDNELFVIKKVDILNLKGKRRK